MNEDQNKPVDQSETGDQPVVQPEPKQPTTEETAPSTEVEASSEPEVEGANDVKEDETITEQPATGDGDAEKPADETTPAETEPAAQSAEEPKDGDAKKPKLKQVWFGIIASVLVLFGGVAAFLTLRGDDDSQPLASETPTVEETPRVTTLGVEVASTEGIVEISRDGGATWEEAPGAESLANLDYVRTQEGSRAIVLFDDGSVARLDENTEVYLSSLQTDGLEITLMSGQVYTRVVESENLSFTVVTANERFESLGTAYKTATDGTKDELEVYQSNVKVESADIEVSEGNKYDTETEELSAIDLSELRDDEFAQWNKERDLESDEFKDKLGVLDEKAEEEDEPTSSGSNQNSNTPQSVGITLTAKQSESSVTLSWTLEGVSSSNGFKVVRDDDDATPDYGDDDAQYVGADSRSHKWWDDDGGTYYYRVCIYRDNGTCDTYSNAVQATSPKVEKEEIEEGDIDLTIDGNTLSWSLDGGTAPHGFKVLLDDDEEPEYPEHSIQYVGAEARSATLPEKSVGTYYVRVCKYTNGTQDDGCVDYSDDVEYTVN